MVNVIQYLRKLEIPYKEFKHNAVFTVKEADSVGVNIPGIQTKSLFLRNKKKDRYLLFCLIANKRADLKKLSEDLGIKHLSFASVEDLQKIMEIKPGSVSPFGVLNDGKHQVELVIDQDILKGESINVHPNDNRATINLKPEDFKKYLDGLENRVHFVSH